MIYYPVCLDVDTLILLKTEYNAILLLTYLCNCPVCLDVDALILLKTEYNAIFLLTYLCNCPVCSDVGALILLKTEFNAMLICKFKGTITIWRVKKLTHRTTQKRTIQ